MPSLVFNVRYPIHPSQLFLITNVIISQHQTERNKLYEEEFDNILQVNKEAICNICIKKKNKLRKLKCKHVFCNSCIREWLVNHSNTCPNCRLILN